MLFNHIPRYTHLEIRCVFVRFDHFLQIGAQSEARVDLCIGFVTCQC